MPTVYETDEYEIIRTDTSAGHTLELRWKPGCEPAPAGVDVPALEAAGVVTEGTLPEAVPPIVEPLLPVVPPHPDAAAHKAMGLALLTDLPLPGLHPDKAAHLLMGLADANDARFHTHTKQAAITSLAANASISTTVTKVNEIITKLKAYGVTL